MKANMITAACLMAVALPWIVGAQPLAAQDAPMKIAVADVETVVAESKPGKELQGQLQAFQQEVQAEMTRLTQTAQQVRQLIADGANTLSDTRLAELEKDYEDATIALRRYRDDKQRVGQKMQEEGLREIERQLEPIFVQVRDEMGFDLILNRVPGVILMSSERIDITPILVERFNAVASSLPDSEEGGE